MFVSALERASQKQRSHMSVKGEGYWPRTGTPMSSAEPARLFRECRKIGSMSTTAAVPEPMKMKMNASKDDTYMVLYI